MNAIWAWDQSCQKCAEFGWAVWQETEPLKAAGNIGRNLGCIKTFREKQVAGAIANLSRHIYMLRGSQLTKLQ